MTREEPQPASPAPATAARIASVGVDGEEGGAEPRDALDRARDGVVDVEDLDVEKVLLARARRAVGEAEATGEDIWRPTL